MPRKFLVVVDDTPEMQAALRYAARRARSTGGRVALLRVLSEPTDEHWPGVREELMRELRAEAEALLSRLGEQAMARSGAAAEFFIETGDAAAAIRKVAGADPDIKILVLASAVGGKAPGPLIAAALKHGAAFSGRPLPVTIVPGELTDADIEDLA